MPISAPDLAILAQHSTTNFLRNQAVDYIGTAHPLLKKLMAGRKKLLPQPSNQIQIRKAYGSQFSWNTGETARTFSKRDTIRTATYGWKTALDGFYIPWDNLFAAGIEIDPSEGSKGKLKLTANEKVVLTNIMTEQMEALSKGFEEKLDIELHRDGTSSADAMAGLDLLISRTPAVGTVGGIDAATDTKWRNYFAGAVAQANLLDTMEAMWQACHRSGNGMPDTILAGTTFVNTYRKVLTLTQNVDAGRVKRLDAGVGEGTSTGLFFKGVEVTWNPVHSDLDVLEAPLAANLWEKRAYFINSKKLKYEDDDMKIYNPASPHTIRATYVSLDVRLRLMTDCRNAHGVIIVA